MKRFLGFSLFLIYSFLFLSLARASVTHDLIFVLDSSGSMVSGVIQGINETPWSLLKKGLAESLKPSKGIVPTNGFVEVTVINFSDSAIVAIPPTILSSEDQAEDLVEQILNMKAIDGGTIYESAFRSVLNILDSLEKNSKKIVIFISDGLPGDDISSYGDDLQEIKNRGLEVWTIGIIYANQDTSSQELINVLTSIASSPDKFRECRTIDCFEKVISEILSEIFYQQNILALPVKVGDLDYLNRHLPKLDDQKRYEAYEKALEAVGRKWVEIMGHDVVFLDNDRIQIGLVFDKNLLNNIQVPKGELYLKIISAPEQYQLRNVYLTPEGFQSDRAPLASLSLEDIVMSLQPSWDMARKHLLFDVCPQELIPGYYEFLVEWTNGSYSFRDILKLWINCYGCDCPVYAERFPEECRSFSQ